MGPLEYLLPCRGPAQGLAHSLADPVEKVPELLEDRTHAGLGPNLWRLPGPFAEGFDDTLLKLAFVIEVGVSFVDIISI
jgi:hypothetical protein